MALFFFKIFFFDKNKSFSFFFWMAFDSSKKIKNNKKNLKLCFLKIYKSAKFFDLEEKNIEEEKKNFYNFFRIQKSDKSLYIIYDFFKNDDISDLKNEKNNLAKNFQFDLKRNKNIFWLKNSTLMIKKKKKFLFPILHQKDFLFNEIIFLFFRDEVNFFTRKMKHKNQCLFNVILESLWILDSQYNKFWERKKHGGKISLPSNFLIKFFGSKIYIDLWYKPKNKIKKCKILKEINLRKISMLIKIVFKLYNNFNSPDWVENLCVDAFLKLPETFVSYANYNKLCLFRTEKNHSRIFFRDYKLFMEIQTIEIKEKKLHFLKKLEIKSVLNSEFKKIGNYFSFNLVPFLPEDKHERAKVLESINVSFPIEILKYFPGGNKRKIIYCWKIPQNKNQRSILKKNVLINKEILNFPIFFSRAMLRKSKKVF